MIFSEQNWNNGMELQKVLKSSSAIEFITMKPLLTEAYNMFLVPLLGDDMIKHLEEEYASDIDSNPVILAAQRAVANLAVWYNFYEMTVILSGSGIQKAETGDYKGLYRYQEIQLRETYKNKGFNALDDVLKLLEKNIKDYPEYEQAPAYIARKTAIVPGAEVIQKYLNVESSRIMFLSLQPHISFIEKTRLPSIISRDLLNELLHQLEVDATLETKWVNLLDAVRPVVVLLAAARLVRDAGILTDKGLYFFYTSAAAGDSSVYTPADLETRTNTADRYEKDAAAYIKLLDQIIKSDFPDFYQGGDNFKVDNSGRKIFWAL